MTDQRERWISESLASAPPLTDDQRRRLAALLRPTVTAAPITQPKRAPKVTCPVCGRSVAILKGGKIRPHGITGRLKDGSSIRCRGTYMETDNA